MVSGKTEVLVEANFRSFLFYFTIQMLLLVILFVIKLSGQVNILKNCEKENESVRTKI